LLDEPLSNLDPALRERTRRQIRQAVERVGITAVWVTHEQEEAFDVGDRVAVLHRGLMDQVGAPEELYLEPKTPFVARFVGRASMVEGTWGDEAVVVDEGGRHQAKWEAKAGENLDAGDDVSVFFRPEGLELCASTQSEAIAGLVAERRYGGAQTHYTIQLDGDRSIEVEGGVRSAAPGDSVGVRPRPEGPAGRAFRRQVERVI
jgi:iron(III) transport system ATP-binding protein